MRTEEPRYHGSLVAFEGPPETVSTQLHLLPQSPQILILPGLAHYLSEESRGRPFDAREYIYRCHKAAELRQGVALDFLKQSTPARKRLVFMNGGTVDAQTRCIQAISQHDTGGNLAQADAIFRDLVRGGVTGLSDHDDEVGCWSGSIGLEPRASIQFRGGHHLGGSVGDGLKAAHEKEADDVALSLAEEEAASESEMSEDPTVRAIRAADELYRKTASLQPLGHGLDLTFASPRASRVRSTRHHSLPTFTLSEGLVETTTITTTTPTAHPFHAFSGTSDAEDPSEFSFVRRSIAPSSIDSFSLMDQVEMSEALARRSLNIRVPPPPPQSCSGEMHDTATTAQMVSPLSDSFTSPPASPADRVVYGEARVLQMRSSPPQKPMRRIKSLDRFYSNNENAKQLELPSIPDLRPTRQMPIWRNTSRRYSKRHSSCVNVSRMELIQGRGASHLEVPKAVLIKANETTIAWTNTLKGARAMRRADAAEVGEVAANNVLDVAKGTDTAGSSEEWSEARSVVEEEGDEEERIFYPVLPLVEDLVIRFSDEALDDFVEFIIQGFRNGTYPITRENRDHIQRYSLLQQPASSSTAPSSRRPSLSVKTSRPAMSEGEGSTKQSAPTTVGDSDEYDPYADHGSYGRTVARWVQKGPIERMCATAAQNELPTPARTPTTSTPPNASALTESTSSGSNTSPSPRPISSRFHSFSLVGWNTAVNVQNALRSVLHAYYLGNEEGYRQDHFLSLSTGEKNSLWRPLFRRSGTGRTTNGHEPARQIDLILAMGAQKGVSREYTSAITGQMEKLGTKQSGLSCSGRLNLRYLIASALQAYAALVVASRHVPDTENPPRDPGLLAALVVGQLETYLAAHEEVRFLLLEYDADRLEIVLELRKLIGTDTFKVAGIVANEHVELLSPNVPCRSPSRLGRPGAATASGGSGGSGGGAGGSIIRSNSYAKQGSHESGKQRHQGEQQQAGGGSPSTPNRANQGALSETGPLPDRERFAKADYQLSSTATDSAIATFISTVWKVLIALSEFYVPEHARRKISSHASLRRATSPYVKVTPLVDSSQSPNASCFPSPPAASFPRRHSSLAALASVPTSPSPPPAASTSIATAGASNHGHSHPATRPTTASSTATGLSALPTYSPFPASLGTAAGADRPGTMQNGMTTNANMHYHHHHHLHLPPVLVPPMTPSPVGARAFSPTPSSQSRASTTMSVRSGPSGWFGDGGASRAGQMTRERMRATRAKRRNATIGPSDTDGGGMLGKELNSMLNGSDQDEDKAGWEMDEAGEDDEVVDLEERRLMPMFGRRHTQMANGRKALKLLGLE